MVPDIDDQQLSLHLRGTLTYFGNPSSSFNGVIKTGLRLVLWGNSDRRVTSCVFTEDLDMSNLRQVFTEIIIFSGKSIDKEIEENETYSIGIPGIKMAEFKIKKIIGKWPGKIPQPGS